MKTFEDLIFQPHPHAVNLRKIYTVQQQEDPYIKELLNGKQARMDFDNGYGISVLFGSQFYSNGKDNYEVAVLQGGRLCGYFPEDSVKGYLTAHEITKIMKELQQKSVE